MKWGENLAVLGSPDIEIIINRRTHGLEARELAPMLASLCEAGLIEVKHHDSGVRARSLPEIESAFAVSSCRPGRYSGFWYTLTPEGGALWESLTRPDWSRYCKGEWGKEQTCLKAGSHERLEAELTWQATDPWSERVSGSEVWTVVRPWEATYWKTLPEGFEVRYRRIDKKYLACNLQAARRPVPPPPWYDKPEL
ncbi:hypothetical protein ASNO1_59430 [Corallococcus caeni]|uniref:Uncharacterized protein n=1 Tax=Corallococcus caeni TaxID=3082388 RepID=A0ABQ6R1D8_9BACT|nr:hypothetical protein ASNO1_59430 [Corallococcus sp. NO1]